MQEQAREEQPLTELEIGLPRLSPGMSERGKIKLGRRGSRENDKRGRPERLDHFLITGINRGADGNFEVEERVHQSVGAEPREIKVRLLFDRPELNVQSRYAVFTRTRCWCIGDGRRAHRLKDGNDPQAGRVEVPCPCERLQSGWKQDAGKCGLRTMVPLLLEDMPEVGAVYKFRTTSYYSTENMLSTLAQIRQVAGGVLAGLPLLFRVEPRLVTERGSGETRKIMQVGFYFSGGYEELRDLGVRELRTRIDCAMDARRLQEETAQMLSRGERAAPPDGPQGSLPEGQAAIGREVDEGNGILGGSGEVGEDFCPAGAGRSQGEVGEGAATEPKATEAAQVESRLSLPEGLIRELLALDTVADLARWHNEMKKEHGQEAWWPAVLAEFQRRMGEVKRG